MSFNFLQAYIKYNSGNMVPRDFHIWSGLVALAAAANKQVWCMQGDYVITYPNIYVGLVGDMGSKKSTAKDYIYDLFITTFPNYPVVASVQSREDIIKTMGLDDNCHSYIHPQWGPTEVRRIVGFINELKNFFSVDIAKMVDFLTDIYSTTRFKSGTIKRGLEDLPNPCVNLLACGTPKWIMQELKGGIIAGGWARRIIYVYPRDPIAPIAFPYKPPDAPELWKACSEHLVRVSETIGEMSWDEDAKTWYIPWFEAKEAKMLTMEDELMRGYYASKHDQLLKVTMLLGLAEYPINMRISKTNLELALAMLDKAEVNMPKLSAAVGRNELSLPMQNILELLEKGGGWMPEKALKRLLGKDMTPMEIEQVLRFMSASTDEIVIQDVVDEVKVKRKMVMTKAKYEEEVRKRKEK